VTHPEAAAEARSELASPAAPAQPALTGAIAEEPTVLAPRPAMPPEPAYPMALEPPDSSPPTVPVPRAGAHDAPGHPAYAAGAAPVGAAPVSGGQVPGGPPAAPFGGPPPGGYPGYPGYPVAPPALRRGRGVVVALSVAVALLLIGGGVMTVLWLGTAAELDRTERTLAGQVADLRARVGDADRENRRLSGELEEWTDQAESLQQELAGSQAANDELKEEKSAIRECFLLLGEMGEADAAGDLERVAELLEDSEEVCERMDAALGL